MGENTLLHFDIREVAYVGSVNTAKTDLGRHSKLLKHGHDEHSETTNYGTIVTKPISKVTFQNLSYQWV